MKRGELSMEVIIIAAIALLVLVILSVLILRSGVSVSDGTGCESGSVQGKCTAKDTPCETGYIPGVNTCSGTDMKCCIPLTKQQG